jgi:hypothetical protein
MSLIRDEFFFMFAATPKRGEKGGRGSFRRRMIKVQGSKVRVMEYRDRGFKGKVEVSGVRV